MSPTGSRESCLLSMCTCG